MKNNKEEGRDIYVIASVLAFISIILVMFIVEVTSTEIILLCVSIINLPLSLIIQKDKKVDD